MNISVFAFRCPGRGGGGGGGASLERARGSGAEAPPPSGWEVGDALAHNLNNFKAGDHVFYKSTFLGRRRPLKQLLVCGGM